MDSIRSVTTDPTRARDVHQLEFKLEGINNRVFDGFNLATHSTARFHEPPVYGGTLQVIALENYCVLSFFFIQNQSLRCLICLISELVLDT